MKSMKKSYVVLLLITTMLMQLLTGCSLGKATVGNEGADGSVGSDVLQIGVVAKGYGDEFLRQLAKAYETKTGVKTELVKTTAQENSIRASLQAGPNNNDLDVIFDIWNTPMNALATANYVPGYERCFAPLSDIYDKVPDGWSEGKTLKELTMPYAMKACTWGGENAGYGDGNQYFVCYAMGVEGLIYNVALFEQYGLKEPKTTNEFFALLDKMKTLNKGSYPKNDDGRDIYPYVYSGKVDYSNYLATAWWAQYEGVDNFNLALEGKDANGNYTADSQKSIGKLSAITHVSRLLKQKNGYSDPLNYSNTFTNAQLLFLDNQAFMMSTGEWVEREMEGNFKGESLNIAFMRIPVNSDIIMQCESVKTEAQLVETIAYIDGDTAEKPAYLSDADLARLIEARSVYCSEGNQHIAYIPVYSNKVEEAKDFLLFAMSKEGQEIMLKHCYGNLSTLDTDTTQLAGYDTLSTLQKSKYEMLVSNVGLSLVGNCYSHPMAYIGGIKAFYNSPTLETAFGVVETSASYKTPEAVWQQQYENVAVGWSSAMQKAGVSN